MVHFPIHRGPVLAILAVVLALMIPACKVDRDPKPEGSGAPLGLEGWAMGTSWKVLALAPDTKRAHLLEEITTLLEGLEAELSHYRDDSGISRFNRAGAGVSVPVAAETAKLVLYGERMRGISGGAFDIRVARAVADRGFGPEALATGEPDRNRPTGTLTVGTDPPSLTKDESGLAIDLSAFAKGHAVDRVAALLDAEGVHDYLVEIGGELKAKGLKTGGEPWSVGIEVPSPDGHAVHLGVTLRDESIASSGNYRLFRDRDGAQRVSHLVDPRRPDAQDDPAFRSVSVILPEAMHADAWATALFVLGEVEGPRVAREHQIPACFLRLDSDGEVRERLVAGFAQRVFR
jgi:thiamine biosynthesis lipoprotein